MKDLSIIDNKGKKDFYFCQIIIMLGFLTFILLSLRLISKENKGF